MDELAELEEEISASAQRFAREVQEDVRHTVRSLREELTQAARQMRGRERDGPQRDGPECDERERRESKRDGSAAGDASRGPGERATGQARSGDGERHQEEWRRQREQWREQTQAWKREWHRSWDDAWKTATGSPDEIVRLKLERVLRRFVEEVRTATADGGSLDETRLAAARTLLDDTLRRLREDVLRSAPPSDTPPPP
jgi:hypothetical protein